MEHVFFFVFFYPACSSKNSAWETGRAAADNPVLLSQIGFVYSPEPMFSLGHLRSPTISSRGLVVRDL
jgi:hypothetical protein